MCYAMVLVACPYIIPWFGPCANSKLPLSNFIPFEKNKVKPTHIYIQKQVYTTIINLCV